MIAGNDADVAVYSSLIGVIGLVIAGYLGGELVFRHDVAVDVPSSAPKKA